MVRSELIQNVAVQNPHLYQREVEKIVDTIFDKIVDTLATGDRVELRGFGSFSLRRHKAREGRNPRTQVVVPVEAKTVANFKTGKEMRLRLNKIAASDLAR